MQELYHKLLRDIELLGIHVEFKLELKSYSKTFFGRYNPNNHKVTIYVHHDAEGKRMYSYRELLLTVVHELIHAIQWNSLGFIRQPGVMHDYEFHRLYKDYSDRVNTLIYYREMRNVEFYSTNPYEGTSISC